jgi:hypothetical protein
MDDFSLFSSEFNSVALSSLSAASAVSGVSFPSAAPDSSAALALSAVSGVSELVSETAPDNVMGPALQVILKDQGQPTAGSNDDTKNNSNDNSSGSGNGDGPCPAEGGAPVKTEWDRYL